MHSLCAWPMRCAGGSSLAEPSGCGRVAGAGGRQRRSPHTSRAVCGYRPWRCEAISRIDQVKVEDVRGRGALSSPLAPARPRPCGRLRPSSAQLIRPPSTRDEPAQRAQVRADDTRRTRARRQSDIRNGMFRRPMACPAAALLRLRPGSAQLMQPVNTEPGHVRRLRKLAYDSRRVYEL